MKKIVKIVGLFFVSTFIALAISCDSFAGSETNSTLFIESPITPEVVVKKANDEWKNHVITMDNSSQLNRDNIEIGSPFSIYNAPTEIQNVATYYFPIVYENQILYLLQMDVDKNDENSIHSSMSAFLTSELNELSEKSSTTPENSVKLFYDNGDVCYTLANESGLLFTDKTTDKKEEFKHSDNFTVTEDSVVSDIFLTTKIQTRSGENPPWPVPVEYNFDMSTPFVPYETQGREPWCGAIAASEIVNLKEKKQVSTAKKFLKKIYPKASDQELKTKFVTDKQMSDYINSYGYKSKWENKTLSYSEIKTQIDKKNPIGMLDKNMDPTAGDHGTVILGYVKMSDGAILYMIFNPWWKQVSTFADDGKYIFTQGEMKFQWTKSLTNIQK